MKCSSFGKNPGNYFEPWLLFVVPFPHRVAARFSIAAVQLHSVTADDLHHIHHFVKWEVALLHNPEAQTLSWVFHSAFSINSFFSLPKSCCMLSAYWTFLTRNDERVDISNIWSDPSFAGSWWDGRDLVLCQKVCSFWALGFFTFCLTYGSPSVMQDSSRIT